LNNVFIACNKSEENIITGFLSGHCTSVPLLLGEVKVMEALATLITPGSFLNSVMVASFLSTGILWETR
jgi:hypothetical protein